MPPLPHHAARLEVDAGGTPVQALLDAHPASFTAASAQRWWEDHRAALQRRLHGPQDSAQAVSSGCAATGARRHAEALAEAARDALERWERGEGARCAGCGLVLPLERLAAVPAAVRCTGCCPPSAVDTRWCR